MGAKNWDTAPCIAWTDGRKGFMSVWDKSALGSILKGRARCWNLRIIFATIVSDAKSMWARTNESLGEENDHSVCLIWLTCPRRLLKSQKQVSCNFMILSCSMHARDWTAWMNAIHFSPPFWVLTKFQGVAFNFTEVGPFIPYPHSAMPGLRRNADYGSSNGQDAFWGRRLFYVS